MAGNDADETLEAQGYGATLWVPDEPTVANAQVSRYIRWLADRVITARDGEVPVRRTLGGASADRVITARNEGGAGGSRAGAGYRVPGEALAEGLAGRSAPEERYAALWEWSVERPGEFWDSVWDYFGVLGDRGDGSALAYGGAGGPGNAARAEGQGDAATAGEPEGPRTAEEPEGPATAGEPEGPGTAGEAGATAGEGRGRRPVPGARWFSGARVNYARNALRVAGSDPDRLAIIAHSERGRTGSLSYGQLADEVGRVAAGLRALGVTRGDRVAALMPNIPETVIALLATASIGAIWSSCSPDFGVRSVVDRFAQIDPKVLIAVDGYAYNGKYYDRTATVREIAARLPSLKAVITPDRWRSLGADNSNKYVNGSDSDNSNRELEFEEVPFEHPLWVVYSSGTTGLPKPIMHGHGGIVLEHLKALAFHLDIGPGDRFTWYTTTGWMMWNFLVGGLLAGATIVLYDGSATHPETGRLWELAEAERLTYLGVGAPYLMACQKAGLKPGERHDLGALRGIGSTGSPLPPEGFGWVYDDVKSDVQLGSLSGGTDVCTGFVGSSPLLPVRAGVISGRCLGAKVEAFAEDGTPVIGEVGELVVTAPMPSMPVGFWNDADGSRYSDSYFADFPGVWRHGDWIEILPDGGCVIFGRSDATLNRGGVRMGTSEFYRVVEQFPEIADSLVVDTGRIGQEGKLILFTQLTEGSTLDDDLIGRVNGALRGQLSPRHVPDEIHVVPGVPRTLSGKKLEIPVRKILLGTPVAEAADPSALANPEVLGSYVPGPRL